MKRGIKSLIISIVLTVSIVLISIPMWRVAQGKNIGLIAGNYGELPITVKVDKFESLIIIEDTEASTIINPTNINLRNRNGFEKTNNIYLLVEKRSTVPYQFLRVSLGEEIYHLSDVEMTEDSDNYYFKLKEVKIASYSEENIDARIWLSTETNGLDNTSSLITNFIVK